MRLAKVKDSIKWQSAALSECKGSFVQAAQPVDKPGTDKCPKLVFLIQVGHDAPCCSSITISFRRFLPCQIPEDKGIRLAPAL
jgi:hypothetical protein